MCFLHISHILFENRFFILKSVSFNLQQKIPIRLIKKCVNSNLKNLIKQIISRSDVFSISRMFWLKNWIFDFQKCFFPIKTKNVWMQFCRNFSVRKLCIITFFRILYSLAQKWIFIINFLYILKYCNFSNFSSFKKLYKDPKSSFQKYIKCSNFWSFFRIWLFNKLVLTFWPLINYIKANFNLMILSKVIVSTDNDMDKQDWRNLFFGFTRLRKLAIR